jgi:hypothetical protein
MCITSIKWELEQVLFEVQYLKHGLIIVKFGNGKW